MLKFSPDDIATQTFERKFRGYDPEQVEEFLQTLARQVEKLVGELDQTRETLEERNEELKDYRDREKSLHDTLEMAKKMGEEIKERAQRDAELTVADAEMEAERILSDAEERLSELRRQIYDLKQQKKRYAAEMKSVVESHRQMLEQMDMPDNVEDPTRRPPAAPETDSNPDDEPAEAASDSSPDDDGEAMEVGDDDIEHTETSDGPPIVT